jgi:hypothetical protein
MKPQPSDDAVYYDAEVTVTFTFQVLADDDMMADTIASYEWEENTFRGSIDNISVEMIEEEEYEDEEEVDEDE